MILIISDKHDVHADIVQDKIIKANYEVFRFNLDVESLKKTYITYDSNEWVIEQNDLIANSQKFKSIWFRRAFVELLLEEKDNREPDFLIWKNEWNKILLGFYLSILNKPCLCPLKQSYASENKFLQFIYAKEIGFNIPDYITSNNKKKLLDFFQLKSGNVVLKLHHQDFYNIDNVYQGIYVNKISLEMLNEFQDESENPITLQEYINKNYEVRYTVVGDKHFCCRINSQSSNKANIDWRRYDMPNTPHFAMEAPEHIKLKIDTLMSRLDINYGALDFIVDKNNEWYFLEINPMGQWLWIEDLTGIKISDAISNWLITKAKEVKI